MRSWCSSAFRAGNRSRPRRELPQLPASRSRPVAKVLKPLAGSGLVASQRGARGGYRLMRRLAGIPIAEVIAAIDGPIALAACVEAGLTGLRMP